MSDKRVLVGMSGGVDSSAAAILLQQAGYEPVGCMLRLYDNGAPEAAEDARRVCRGLGIDFCLTDDSGRFRDRVMDNFVACYAAGRTPQPLHPVQPLYQI